MALVQTLFGEWEESEPVDAPEIVVEDEDHAWNAGPGPWQEITTAPRDQPVDLWVDTFELYGEVVPNCRWNANAAIPDWYHGGKNGERELAVKPHHFASYWKPRDAKAGPVDDGGPGLFGRTNIASDITHWPEQMRERYARYQEQKET